LTDEQLQEDPAEEDSAGTPRWTYRPLGDPGKLSPKEASEILGKARNTLYLCTSKESFSLQWTWDPYMHQASEAMQTAALKSRARLVTPCPSKLQ
jgi:hypothetical protein